MGLGRDFLDLIRGKGLNPDGVGQDSERTENNKKVIDSIAIENDMDQWLREDALNTHELNRQLQVMFKHARQRHNKVLTQLELFVDQWCQHHGPIVTQADVKVAKLAGVPKDKLPKENFSAFASSAIRYAKRIVAIVNQRREEAEWRAMQGPLASEFVDFHTPFGDLPGDSDFEAAILKEQPWLKEFKK